MKIGLKPPRCAYFSATNPPCRYAVLPLLSVPAPSKLPASVLPVWPKKSPSMRMAPKLVPWLGVWLNCAVPAVVSKVFFVMEVLGRVTVKMLDPWVNCVSLDWV